MSCVKADNRLNPGNLTMLERLAWPHFQCQPAKLPESDSGDLETVNMHIICFLSILEAIVPLNVPLKMSMAADCQTKNKIPSHSLTSPPPPCVLVLTYLVCGLLAYLLVLFRFTILPSQQANSIIIIIRKRIKANQCFEKQGSFFL